MAETAENVQTTTPEQETINQDFAHHMAMAFGEQSPAQTTETGKQNEAVTTTTPPLPEETPTVTKNTDEEVIDSEVYLKNTFGWESVAQGMAELEELRKLKGSQPSAVDLKFENEQSRHIHELLRQGKTKEVREFLESQDRISSFTTSGVSKENAEDIIKLSIQLANKDNQFLTKEDIDFQYKQDFGLPKEPVQKATEDEDDFLERHNEWKERVDFLEQKKMVAAKMAISQIDKHRAELKLPDISPATTTINKDYEDYMASLSKSKEDYSNVVVPAITALKESDLQMSIKVDDPNNQMQFDISIVPESADFDYAKNNSLDIMGWLSKTFYDEKGNFDAAKLNRAILIEKNFDKYAQSAARQAVNAERKRVVLKESGSNGLKRDFNVNPQQMTELQKELERSFAV